VSSSIVVVLEPGAKSGAAGGVGGEDLPISPFALEASVEPLDLPVLPGAVRLDQQVGGPDLGQQPRQGAVAGVAPVVVGHDRLDASDAVSGEVLDRAGQELGAGRGFLVGEDLGIREAAVVVDQRVDVIEADPGFLCAELLPIWRPWARHPPPSGIRPIFLTSM